MAYCGDRFELDVGVLQGHYELRTCSEHFELCSEPLGPIPLPEPAGLSLLAALVLLVLLPRRGRTG